MADFQGGDLPKGSFRPFGDNEVILRSYSADPVKYRGDAPVGGGGVLVSGSVDGVELGFCGIREDERFRGTSQRVGVFEVFVRRPRVASDPPDISDDALMVRVFSRAWEYGLDPVTPAPLPGDTFAQAVRVMYRDILQRPALPFASDAEVDGHRGNPGGLPAIQAMCEALGPGH